ncbi:MAG: hypothetical protein NC324_01240 [Bacteroides sp.]|nr:hypothetical protein [Bacteroides sp.]MCM1531438.1 hypothetical protein [Ruminococcus flavefaciens]
MDKSSQAIVNRYGGYVYGMYLIYTQNRERIALNVPAVRSFFEGFGYGKVSPTRAKKLIQLVRRHDWNPICVPRMPLKRGRPKKGEPPRPKRVRRPRKPKQMLLPFEAEQMEMQVPRTAKNLTVKENIENCQKAAEWLEFVAEITYSTVPYVRAKLNEFRVHLGAYALDDPRPAREFKKHFVNWLKRERRKPVERPLRCVPASALTLFGSRFNRNNNPNSRGVMINKDNDMRIAYAALKSAWIHGDTFRDTSQAFYAIMRLELFKVNGYTEADMRRDAVRMASGRTYSELDTNSEYIKAFIRKIQREGRTVDDVMTVYMTHVLQVEGWNERAVVA